MLRRLLGHCLRGAARKRIQDELAQAARRKVAARAAPGETCAENSCIAGVVFALGIEAGGLVDLLARPVTRRLPAGVVRLGRLRGGAVALIQSGAGPQRAAAAARALLAGHRPRWIVSAGFAGGLAPQVKRHDLVLADSVAGPDGRRLAIDLAADPAALGPRVHVGRILSVGQIVRQPAEKELLGRQHEALAVDLESLAVAEVCRAESVRFLAVRVVTDAMDERLPADIERLTDQPSAAARLGAAVGAIWRRPASVKDLYLLRENALVASDRLARLLADVIETLAAGAPPAGS